jgi:hypothetical protein
MVSLKTGAQVWSLRQASESHCAMQKLRSRRKRLFLHRRKKKQQHLLDINERSTGKLFPDERRDSFFRKDS